MKERAKRIVRSPFIWLAVLLIAPVAVGYGFFVGLEADGRDAVEESNVRILAADVPAGFVDERRGSYRGIAVGDPASAVVAEMGEPASGNKGISIPQIAFGQEWSGLGTYGCPGRGKWRSQSYREAAFVIVGDRVCVIQVGGNGWRTSGGLEAGDSIDIAKERFGPGECYETGPPEALGYDQWMCEFRTTSGVKLYFGGDPLNSVTLLSPRRFEASEE